MLKEFSHYKELEIFVYEVGVNVLNIWRFDDSDIFTATGDPDYGKICNYIIRWVLNYEIKEVKNGKN